MKKISVQQFCIHYDVSPSFMDALSTFELVEFLIEENDKYIRIDDINRVERLMRMHFELDVNFEGLDVISNLIDKINTQEKELIELRNRLGFYE